MKTTPKPSNKSSCSIFLSKGFLLSLFILFVNDFFLKELFHNWVTGKLSDFSGLFVFAIFWAALFPKKSKLVYVSVAAFFIFWKSPLSEPLIESINIITFLNYKRVLDWTDLLALTVLIPAYWYQFQHTNKRLIKIPVIVPILFASFLFVATSIDDHPQGIIIEEEYELAFSHDSLFIKLNSIDSIGVYSSDSIPKTFENFSLSFYSYNCENRLSVNCKSSATSDSTCTLDFKTVFETSNCYKVADPNKVEQSIKNLIMELEEEIINKLD